jgi:hypothetical protein
MRFCGVLLLLRMGTTAGPPYGEEERQRPSRAREALHGAVAATRPLGAAPAAGRGHALAAARRAFDGGAYFGGAAR